MNDDVPHSVWSGSFEVFGVDLKCHVLSNGQHIIEEASIRELIAAMEASGEPTDEIDITELAKWINS